MEWDRSGIFKPPRKEQYQIAADTAGMCGHRYHLMVIPLG
jgi:hypothetical protein